MPQKVNVCTKKLLNHSNLSCCMSILYISLPNGHTRACHYKCSSKLILTNGVGFHFLSRILTLCILFYPRHTFSSGGVVVHSKLFQRGSMKAIKEIHFIFLARRDANCARFCKLFPRSNPPTANFPMNSQLLRGEKINYSII